MATYNGYLKYKDDAGEIQTLLPKTNANNVFADDTSVGEILADHGARITALESWKTTADSNITANTNDIADAKTDIQDIETNIEGINGSITQLTEKNTAQDTSIKKNADDIAALKTEVDGLSTPQCYISDTQPAALACRDWWFDIS